MSRRRAEFEHRTSIFEGAYRAWSGLGGLEPVELETKSAEELNPLTHPLKNDDRCITGKPIKKQNKKAKNETSPVTSDQENDNSNSDDNKDEDFANPNPGRRIFPYEPLPRAGLAHPFVQAILSPWLGADADDDAIQVGLTTLRTWWQHRRRGESGSAITALGTERMQNVVGRYTNHFFNLAYTLVVEDREQAPRTLMVKINALEKVRKKKSKKRARENEATKLKNIGLGANGYVKEFGIAPSVPLLSKELSSSAMHPDPSMSLSMNMINHLSSKIDDNIPYNVDLEPTPIESIYAAAREEASRGEYVPLPSLSTKTKTVTSPKKSNYDYSMINNPPTTFNHSSMQRNQAAQATQSMLSGEAKASSRASSQQFDVNPNKTVDDASTTPVVILSRNGDIQIAMSIDGITCISCVKIVETVLKGCNGNKSPIEGLLDAAADMNLKRVLIKIDKSSNAKRIAFEAGRNLSMVGYTAKVKEMSTYYAKNGRNGGAGKFDFELLNEACLAVGASSSYEDFDWTLKCTCPDNGVLRDDCARHSQMNTQIFEKFDVHERKVNAFMAGCGQRYGGDCTCGEECRCNECPIHNKNDLPVVNERNTYSNSNYPVPAKVEKGGCCGGSSNRAELALPVSRNSSIRRDAPGRQSMYSAGSFGRAMSALSQLSIDWENMEDFDVEVDHSAHINVDNPPPPQSQLQPQDRVKVSDKEAEGIYEGCSMMYGGICNCGPTCVCVGCPIHDPDSSKEGMPAPTTRQSYTFGETSSGYEKNVKRRNLRSSILWKIKRADSTSQKRGVTFQI